MSLRGGEPCGISTVEMAAILPLLILLVLGATDLGRVFYDAIAVSNAARAGLSYGSLDKAKAKLSYVTTGQDVPDDITVGEGKTLAELILGERLPQPCNGSTRKAGGEVKK